MFANPAKSVDACFTVLARRTDTEPARLGLAISKKCARRAVDRSRLKRVVRESFRRHRADLYGLDLVVLCRRDAVGSRSQRLFDSLSVHWKRILDQLCASC
ncbi:MAG: ribonuclease P protein component [Pseudomonadota bacterium]|nr:ribonuclease P protein component [Pseudomonadota bacterium]